MPTPISLLAAIPPAYQLEPPAPQASFEVAMLKAMRQVALDVEKREVSLDALIRDAASGRRFTNAELLALQAQLHEYTLELELVSKILQQAVQGLREVLRTPV
jgi:hypothetical protein